MKIQFYILLLTVFFVSCSVDDFLDVKPTGTLIPKTVEDFDKLLENPTIGSNTWENMTYMDPDTWLPGNYYDNLSEAKWRKQYAWSDTPYGLEEQDRDWMFKYLNLYTYNLVIQDIDGAELGNKTTNDKKRVKGEAYAQRAFDLFFLVNEYAPAYNDSNKDKPAIPMPLNPNITAQLSKHTVAEVYKQILEDLAKADELLVDVAPINEDANFRPGKASVKALFALIYLHMGDFEKAKTFSSEALSLYDYIYDFTALTTVVVGDPWSGLSTSDFGYSVETKSIIWNRINRYYNGSVDPTQLYHPDLLALFDKANDQRFLLFASNLSYFGDDLSPNYAYSRQDSEVDAGITVPNLILVSAEAKARTGDSQGALDDLNLLLRKRILNFTDLTLATVPDVLQRVKDERRKELMATGNNFVDLRRYHAYGESIPTFTRVINGENYVLEPGSDKYVVPISSKVKSLNPNL